ncbi:hypothetical protein KCV07_g145, partial [Aureobasidium melanogenum]
MRKPSSLALPPTMALLNRPSFSGSLKSDRSAANTKNSVGFSNQPPNESLENKEPAANFEPCNDPEAEKKSSASVENPELKPSKCLYDKKSAYYVMRQVCDHETHQMIELERRLQDKLAGYTYEELLDLERKGNHRKDEYGAADWLGTSWMIGNKYISFLKVRDLLIATSS